MFPMSFLRRIRSATLICAALTLSGCAALLMLPDELSEEHYRTQAGDIRPQIQAKSKFAPGGKIPGERAGLSKKIAVVPVVYVYDTTNTLKKNEEAYYTSVFNNSSGSWIRPFAVAANTAIYEAFKRRGYDAFVYSQGDLQKLGAKEVSGQMGSLSGTQYKAIAYNAESDESNLAVTNFQDLRKFIGDGNQGVVFMKIQADWEPSSANRLNGDIVLNTAVNLGYEFVFCGADGGCSTVSVPFEKGIVTNLLMPIRNTIKDSGRDKNYDLIRTLHNEQLNQIVEAAIVRIESQK